MESLNETALEILALMKLRSCIQYPSAASAFGKLKWSTDNGLDGVMSTDGITLYYHPGKLCLTYRKSPEEVYHIWRHLHLHCICCHMLYPPECEHGLWELACDILAEKLLNNPEALKEAGNAVWASDIYRRLKAGGLKNSSEGYQTFKADSHAHWEDSFCDAAPDKQRQLVKLWGNKSKRMDALSRGQGTAGREGGGMSLEIQPEPEGKSYDYRKFLYRFMIPREEVLLDTESFDYIPYLYGFEYYQNVPLIEPLEYREVSRLDEIAIAIDTSGSCPAPVVKHFLEETLSILERKENFSAKCVFILYSVILWYRITVFLSRKKTGFPICRMFVLLDRETRIFALYLHFWKRKLKTEK